MRTNVEHILVVLLTLAVIVALSARIIPEHFPGMDLHKYRAIADVSPDIANDIPRPFAFRLLGPYIVGLLPLETSTGFYVFTVLLSFALLVVVYLFLTALTVKRRVSLYVTVLYAFNYFLFSYNIWNYFQIADLLALLCEIVLLWAMLNHRWGVFAAVLFAGVACRETPLIMVPVALVYIVERRMMTSEGIKLLMAALPAVAMFILIRMFIPYEGGMALWESAQVHIGKFLVPATWFKLLIRSFTPLTFLAIVFFTDFVDYLRRRKYLVCLFVLVLLSTMFGTDNERLMAPAFVIFYLPLAFSLQKHLKSDWAYVFLLIVTFGVGYYYMTGQDLLAGIVSEKVVAIVPAAVLAVVTYLFKLGGEGRLRQLLRSQ